MCASSCSSPRGSWSSTRPASCRRPSRSMMAIGAHKCHFFGFFEAPCLVFGGVLWDFFRSHVCFFGGALMILEAPRVLFGGVLMAFFRSPACFWKRTDAIGGDPGNVCFLELHHPTRNGYGPRECVSSVRWGSTTCGYLRVYSIRSLNRLRSSLAILRYSRVLPLLPSCFYMIFPCR